MNHYEHPHRHQTAADGMGLSTHVETSDKGSRRYYRAHNEERIDEVEEEGSGRTSPPGTIGEVHEYMSENIESYVVNKFLKKKGTGNQSVMGPKDHLNNP
jgi:hypothetical protein